MSCSLTSNHRSNSPDNDHKRLTPLGHVIREKGSPILYYTIYDPKFVILPMQFDVIVELLNILVKFTVLL